MLRYPLYLVFKPLRSVVTMKATFEPISFLLLHELPKLAMCNAVGEGADKTREGATACRALGDGNCTRFSDSFNPIPVLLL